MSARPVLVRDRRTAVALGVALALAGAYLLYDAYEGRGQHRPFLLRLVPW